MVGISLRRDLCEFYICYFSLHCLFGFVVTITKREILKINFDKKTTKIWSTKGVCVCVYSIKLSRVNKTNQISY